MLYLLFPCFDLLVFLVLRIPRTTGIRLIAEHLLLKSQLEIVHRSKNRPKLDFRDRVSIGLCSLFLSDRQLLRSCIQIKPSSARQYMRMIHGRHYWKFMARTGRRKPGPKGKSAELVHLVIEIKQRNPSYGTPRIAMLINNVIATGTISEATVRRILRRPWQPAPIRPNDLRVFLVTCASVSFVRFWIRWTIRQPLGAWIYKPRSFERFVGRVLTMVTSIYVANGSREKCEAVWGLLLHSMAVLTTGTACDKQQMWHRQQNARDGPQNILYAA